MSVEDLATIFESVGIHHDKALEIANNKKLSLVFKQIIDDTKSVDIEKPKGILLYSLATKGTPDVLGNYRHLIIDRILDSRIKREDQLDAAIKYCDRFTSTIINETLLDEFCGVGVTVTVDQIDKNIQEIISQNPKIVQEENNSLLFKLVKENPALKWADKRTIKERFDFNMANLAPLPSSSTIKIQNENNENNSNHSPSKIIESLDSTMRPFEGQVLKLHRPGENKQVNEEIMKNHLKATGGKVVTRFPPEPNGFLHIGHAKAINFSFNYAQAHDGITYLRFDDTNPEAEEVRYYDAIRENVRWLGFTPSKETSASENFQKLYEFAIELIKKGLAYVCHMTPEEIEASRGGAAKGPRWNSPWRDRPIQENLEEFQKMKDGQYEEGKATLRLKQDMTNPNPRMWDLVAYRIMYTPHCLTGRQWNIYPMYDYTHCLCDSIENITHSFCSKEFITAREAYYWTCDSLQVYKAVQWEFSRLKITGTVLSKRKLTKLVELGHVADWDDPRLYTLSALRRRGFTPKAINSFVEDLGITTSSSTVDIRKLESYVRDDLNKSTPRRMAIMKPILLVIENIPDGVTEWISIADNKDSTISSNSNCNSNSSCNLDSNSTCTREGIKEMNLKGEYSIPLTNRIYIDSSDYRSGMHINGNENQNDSRINDPNFYRLTPNQPVGLFKAGVFTFNREEVISFDSSNSSCPSNAFNKENQNRIAGDNGNIQRIIYGTLDRNSSIKPKTFIQWVAYSPENNSPIIGDLRMYSSLFLHDPDSMEGKEDYLSDINPNSLEIVSNAMFDIRMKDAKVEDKYQLQRIGYFCVDPDSVKEVKEDGKEEKKVEGGNSINKDQQGKEDKIKKLILNLTVTLKEDVNKDRE